MASEQLITLFSNLHDPDHRAQAALQLAQHLGVTQVLLFGKDSTVSSFLPALGLPQTLRRGSFWSGFVDACLAQPEWVQEQTLDHSQVQGVADINGNCILAVLGELSASALPLIALLLRPLGLKLVEERLLQGVQSDVMAATQIAQHAEALNKTLDHNRTQLHEAYQRAEAELEQRRRAEDQLTAAIEVSQTIMDYSLDVIALFDGEGRVLEISKSVTRVWGYQPEEMIGQMIFDFILPEDVPSSYAVMEGLAPEQPLINFENRYRRKSGTVVYMLWNATSFGNKGHFIALGRDVTAIKLASMRLEESEQRFRSLFERPSRCRAPRP